jgi:hypothetical protein
LWTCLFSKRTVAFAQRLCFDFFQKKCTPLGLEMQAER